MGVNILRVAICGAGQWGTRLIESVQDKGGKIRFVAAVTRDPAAFDSLGERFGQTVPKDVEVGITARVECLAQRMPCEVSFNG